MYEYVRASLMVCIFSASMRSRWKIWLFIVHCVLLHMPFHHSMSFSENAFNKTNKAKGKEKGCRQISRGLNTSEWHKGVQSVHATPKVPHSSTVYGYPLLFLQRPSHWHTQTHTHTQQQGQWPVSVKYKFPRVWWHRCILWDGLATEAAASQPLDKRAQGWPNSQRDKQTELLQIGSNKTYKTNQIFLNINA